MQKYTQTALHNGFTIIEMSIVLVIIGLIVGGIMVGQDLIRAAQIRNMIKQIDAYKTAVLVFEGKYNCIPGDCANATMFWSQMADCSISAYSTSYSPLTCNGNGNGTVGDGGTNGQENGWFWQHLSNAGLITNDYTGYITQSSYWGVVLGLDVPYVNGYTQAGVMVAKDPWAPAAYYQCPSGNWFWTGGIDPSGGWLETPYLSTIDAFSIDGKIDDGLSISGSVIAPPANGNNANCVNANGYNTLNSAPNLCSLSYFGGF